MKKDIRTKNQNEVLDKVLKTAKKLYLESVEQSERRQAEKLLEQNLISPRKINKPSK